MASTMIRTAVDASSISESRLFHHLAAKED
jgi:hypothetical protein